MSTMTVPLCARFLRVFDVEMPPYQPRYPNEVVVKLMSSVPDAW